jgi:hypothetical protein
MTGILHAEGLDLGCAVVDRVARDLGVRVLAIKGPVAALHGLRPPRTSVDVDVLVEPARFGDVLARLQELGWRPPVRSVAPRVVALHSQGLRHVSWPCEIDLHDRFPGFLADPDDVFEALWAERVAMPVAGRTVAATGQFGSALVMVLHAQRGLDVARHDAEVRGLVAALDARLNDDGRRALRDLAEATGCRQTAVPLLEPLGIETPPVRPQEVDLVSAWRLRTSMGSTRAVPWVNAFRRTPWWRWLPVLLRGLVSSEAELRRDWPQAPSGRRGLWLARWWRLRRGLPDLPQAVALVWRSRHP